MKEPEPNQDPAAPPDPDQTRRLDDPDVGVTRLARILERYMEDLEAGRSPDRERFLADHPDLAGELEPALAGLDFIHRATRGNDTLPSQLGDFRIIREIGRGGMGAVYEAEQISLKRRVALKVLRFGGVADEMALKRFEREAETIAQLHHTNIVPIFAVGVDEGVRYYAMQLIAGQDLSQRSPLNSTGDRPGMETIADWGLQAAEALDHAHRRGIIHRDIKPSNLILDPEGRIWLTDFGLARRMDDAAISVAGAILGTPRYMSPEQAGAASKPVDHRTDIYSLGATLYELVTGRPIFDGPTPQEVLSQILLRDPAAPRQFSASVPRDLETIVLKCLGKEPSQRYRSARALADDLRAFLEGRPIQARRPSLPERLIRWSRKHRQTSSVAAAAAGVSVVLLVAGYLGWNRYHQTHQGQLSLTTSGPNLLAQLLDGEDQAVIPAFPVPTPQPVSLPAGTYQLRLSASGLPSETWPMRSAAITAPRSGISTANSRSTRTWPPPHSG